MKTTSRLLSLSLSLALGAVASAAPPVTLLVDSLGFTRFDGHLGGGAHGCGLVELEFKVHRGSGAECAVATLTVNQPPVAASDGAAATQDRAISIATAKFLHDDTDPDNDPLTIASVNAASINGGSVVLSNNVVIYAPPSGFSGLDQFTYTISDGRGGSATGQVEVLVVSGSLPGQNQVSLTPTPGGLLIRFAGVPGRSYALQRSTDLILWTPLTTVVAPAHGIIQYTDPNPPQPMAIYRTVIP